MLDYLLFIIEYTMTRKLTLLVLTCFTTFQIMACTRAAVPEKDSVAAAKVSGPVPGTVSGNMNDQILYYTNQFRASKGLPPLKMEINCSLLAEKHSQDMAAGRTGFGHEGFEVRAAAIGKVLGGMSGAAENVAYGTLDAKGVVDGWINSPGHRKNMLGNFNLIGIGYAQGKGRIIYFTQLFIKH
ncbi:CAP domain-containing protein [Chitinophaga oryziterrae]|uniref:CAP domain-containing protein n=2 Tax=Chitinophaga oryziterrae TaxID=1031224 RepID=A0A6N8JES3_9BACT|nr:CAP domain-containing protein [Chitinophaga oryziterrae]